MYKIGTRVYDVISKITGVVVGYCMYKQIDLTDEETGICSGYIVRLDKQGMMLDQQVFISHIVMHESNAIES